jgi:hypothetical protein
VPDKIFPDSARADGARIEFDLDGFVRTNMRCHAVGASGLALEALPDGIIAVGGLRYGIDELSMRIAKAAPAATLAVERDALLGARLAVECNDPTAARKTLDAAGQSRLIFEGVRPRAAERRAG